MLGPLVHVAEQVHRVAEAEPRRRPADRRLPPALPGDEHAQLGDVTPDSGGGLEGELDALVGHQPAEHADGGERRPGHLRARRGEVAAVADDADRGRRHAEPDQLPAGGLRHGHVAAATVQPGGQARLDPPAEPGHALDAFRNSMAYVVQLQIEKDALACIGQRARQVDTARKGELVPDLVKGDSIADELVRAIRQISQVKNRLKELKDEHVKIEVSELFILQNKVRSEMLEGRNLLQQMAARTKTQIVKAQRKLDHLVKVNDAEIDPEIRYGLDVSAFR